jgi:hypothetical protein
MNRRQFVNSGASLASLIAVEKMPSGPYLASIFGTSRAVAHMTLSNSPRGMTIPNSFTGLSYEASELVDPLFFSSQNTGLVSLFRQLGRCGSLRIGGNTSDHTKWVGELDASRVSGDSKKTLITKQSIITLSTFLDATNWNLIFGLNYKTGSEAEAADLANFIVKTVGIQRVIFQIGNEPDAGAFSVYYSKWLQYVHRIRSLIPNVVFGGPDVAAVDNVDWVVDFARKAKEQAQLLTWHYYAEGPPNSQKTTFTHLFANDPRLDMEISRIKEASQLYHMPFRMTECNTCYWGGKPGLSDAFGSAIWAGDFMLKLASAGCTGVNFHGGNRAALEVSLGGTLAGKVLAKKQNDIDRVSGFYTAIAGTVELGFYARPLYYGMLLAEQFAGGTMMHSTIHGYTNNLTSYAAIKDSQTLVALFNKDLEASVEIVIDTGRVERTANLWRLSAPNVNSTTDVTLAGAEVGQNNPWNPNLHETIPCNSNICRVRMPPASGAILFFA